MKILARLSFIAFMAFMMSCDDNDANPYMDLSDKEMSISADGGSLTMTVASNVHYVVNHDNEWLNITAIENQKDLTTFIIQVDPNEDLEDRKGRIKFIGDNVTPKALDITQRRLVPKGVSVKNVDVEMGGTEAEFRVLGESAWTATASDPNFILTPSSGEGETVVKVTFPSNNTKIDKVTTITVAMEGEEYTLTITQLGLNIKLITEWALDANKSAYFQSWSHSSAAAQYSYDLKKIGFADIEALPTTGTGAIKFWNSDKGGRSINSNATAQTGGHGDLLIRGIVTTDYLYVQCGNELLDEIPADTPLYFEFTGAIFAGGVQYWMAEYMDDGEWKPMAKTSTITLTATKNLSGNEGSWTENVTYNYYYPNASASNIYTLFDFTFQLSKPAPYVEIRLRPATEISATGLYYDTVNGSNAYTRFSAQHPHVDGKSVAEYNQTVKLEFAD